MNAVNSPLRMDRRAALKWIATATAALAAPGLPLSAQNDINDTAASSVTPDQAAAKGYGTDPDLLKIYKPGDLWPLILSDGQLMTGAALCDIMLPADDLGPNASSLGVHGFIDEWISAPYPGHEADRKLIVEGLAWLDDESNRRFQMTFHLLDAGGRTAICDDICSRAKARPEFKRPAAFFRRFLDLAAAGYYTTPAGMRAIGYAGNLPTQNFEGPPAAVLRKLGLA